MKERIAQSFDHFANGLVRFSQTRGRVTWWFFLFILAGILVTITPFPGHTQATDQLADSSLCSTPERTELRGVWLTNVDSDVLFKPERTSQAIAQLAAANFNTLYPTVWNWGYTLYPSEIAAEATGLALDPTPGLQGRDLLAEIVAEGHQQGLDVIPWFEFGFMAPADSTLALNHPEWLTQRRDGSTIWWEGKVHQRVWLNPLHPEVQQFMTDLIVEIVSNYDIDGIQLDDHFGYPSDLGYDPYTVKLYQADHAGRLPPQDFKDSDWVQWRADRITDYVATLHQEIKQHNPEAIISVSPNPQHFSLNSFLMDWSQWLDQGLIEELIVQVYRDRTDSFVRELEQPEILAAQEQIPVGIGILTGLKGRPISWQQISEQAEIVRQKQLAGMSFFFYESLWNLAPESPPQRQAALNNLFPNQIKAPAINDCQFVSLK